MFYQKAAVMGTLVLKSGSFRFYAPLHASSKRERAPGKNTLKLPGITHPRNHHATPPEIYYSPVIPVRSILSTKYLCNTKYIISSGSMLSIVPDILIDSLMLVTAFAAVAVCEYLS